MTHRNCPIPSHQQHRACEQNSARIIPRRAHWRRPLPSICRGIEPQYLVERSLSRLRFATEQIDVAAVDGCARGSAWFDGWSLAPRIARRIIDLDIAEISRAASSADRVELAVVRDCGGTSFRAREACALRSAAGRRIVLFIIGEERAR